MWKEVPQERVRWMGGDSVLLWVSGVVAFRV